MRDELKYPRAFALMPVPIEMAYNKADFKVFDCVYCYVVSPCYIVRRCTDYMQDEYGIENDVQNAHEHVKHTRNPHVAAALEHASRQPVKLHERQRKGEYHEIFGSHSGNGFITSEPSRQERTYRTGNTHGSDTEHRSRGKRLPQDITCPSEFAGSDKVRHLDAEADRCGRKDSSEKPCTRGHQSYGCRGFRPETADHGGIDIHHYDIGELGKHRRYTEPYNESKPLSPRQRPATSHHLQQYSLSPHYRVTVLPASPFGTARMRSVNVNIIFQRY